MKNNLYKFDNNPFESGHIKSYIFFYAGVVLIMILFFVAANLFQETQIFEKKVFQTAQVEKKVTMESKVQEEQQHSKSTFKLLPKAY